ncbi:hypothetical protein [Phormidium sp. CCY1219]|uniref:hypothetical protein n=1 Tax=Phormidium sp. CCY1219 TaxID=2886104 RepID=UPI002D1F2F44|nr:hypothetical protein [Phormidium sp. CCY1219]MEB3826858.1 hypothetical protein [Phormidium sp. CCY1219]
MIWGDAEAIALFSIGGGFCSDKPWGEDNPQRHISPNKSPNKAGSSAADSRPEV